MGALTLFGILLAGLAGCQTVPAPPASLEYVNGRWWNGRDFAAASVWAVGERLTFVRPPRVGRRVDLEGGYVTPPFTEGHNHWLEPARAEAYSACHLADGVYYVRDMANLPFVADQFRARLNRPATVDWTSTMMGFTGPGGHPVEIVDQFVAFGVLPSTWRPDYDGDAMFVVTDRAGIDAGLERLREQGSTTAKAFLLFSERYRQSLDDPATRGNGRGMDPQLLPYLVERAHRSGLRVAAHVYSAADFRTAVSAGVDEVAHLPGTGYRRDLPASDFQITERDAREAARRQVRVTTTVSWLGELAREDAEAYRDARDRIVIPNLRRLKEAGVTLLIGSDSFRNTVRVELAVLQSLGLFSGTELLAMSAATAGTAFPGARIGHLREGYRADFIVTRGDPRADLSATDHIIMRVKQGEPLSLPAAAAARAGSACVEGAP
jgi:hypothetical protein